MRGDWVEVLVDTGNGVRSFEIAATRDGRRVEVTTSRSLVEVAEVTRTGQTVRSARFLAGRVVAIVEHPARDGRAAGSGRSTDASGGRAAASSTLRRASVGQV